MRAGASTVHFRTLLFEFGQRLLRVVLQFALKLMRIKDFSGQFIWYADCTNCTG
jgi:hypothetical protein